MPNYDPCNSYAPNIPQPPARQPFQYQSMPQPQNYPQQNFQQPIQNTPVMSIAPVSGEANAAQFPVGVGVELWLVDKAAKKIWIKSNSANPREMQEIDFEYVVKQPNQNEPVSRSEFEEMKGMMAQMMTMMQGNPRQNQPSRKERREMRRMNQDEPADDANG